MKGNTKLALVTGASGFIGSRLTQRLSGIKGIEVVALASGRKKIDFLYENIKVVYEPLETISPESFSQTGGNKFDYVFHFAAFIPKSSIDLNNREAIISANIIGTQRLIDAIEIHEKMVFASTVDIYSLASEEFPLDESAEINPKTLYGASKQFCEKLIIFDSENRGYQALNFRLGHVYGPGEEQYKKLIPLAIKTAINKESVTIIGDPNSRRDFIYVDDVVDACIKSLNMNSQETINLNIVSGTSISIEEVVAQINFISGNSAPVIRINPEIPGSSYAFNNERMINSLGEWGLTSFRDGLTNEIEYMRTGRS